MFHLSFWETCTYLPYHEKSSWHYNNKIEIFVQSNHKPWIKSFPILSLERMQIEAFDFYVYILG